jgi:hypothetical protein
MGAGYTNPQICPKNLARVKTGVCDRLDICVPYTSGLTAGSEGSAQASYGHVYVQFQGKTVILRHGTTGPKLLIAKLPRGPHTH